MRPHTAPASALSLSPLPWLVLMAALAVTWLVWDHERESARKELQSRFDFALRDSVSGIEQRVAAYEQMLRGVQGLFATTGLDDRSAFRDYVDTLQLDANFSGIQAIGIVAQVTNAQKASHVAALRRKGFADYRIEPEGERQLYTPIVQREPYIGRNRAPIGIDIWGNAARRQAMEKARDSGMPAITGAVQLVVDKDAEPSPGFIMYLPIFANDGSRATVSQRRAHLIGWVYAAFRMNEFMASLYVKPASGLAFAIYDGADPRDEALMYRAGGAKGQRATSAQASLSANEYMVVAGHTWTLVLSTLDEFEARQSRDMVRVIGVAGMGLSLCLALLSWFMVNGRARALRLAADMTDELRHMAQHDVLTGLPNRALFHDRVQQELAAAKRHGRRFALVFMDLDNFKPINDNYGHAVGDLVLQEAARRLQRVLRSSDSVGRVGGDEFVVLLGDLIGTETETVLALAERLRQEVGLPYKVDAGRELIVSCSLGVAVYPEDGADELTLTRRADEAMYQAKDNGRDKVQMAS